ncbi:MAG: DUF1499 domain-containing protein [Gemmatimonadales bacterium]|nr:MAG: DUF1499 domain-containing protein [Gemmatimonadales bacterium]
MHPRTARTTPILVTTLIVLLAGCSGSPPASLGPVAGGLAPCPTTPNCVHTGAGEPRGVPEFIVAPRWREAPSEDLIHRVSEAVASLPRTRIVEETDRYLRAEATSRIFRFVDDVEVHLTAEGDRLVVRSASRLGRSDLGVNLRRVEQLHDILLQDGVVTNPRHP